MLLGRKSSERRETNGNERGSIVRDRTFTSIASHITTDPEAQCSFILQDDLDDKVGRPVVYYVN